MSKRSIVYRNVAARMALLGMKKSEMAQLLGVNSSTLQHKLRGLSPFTLDEAIQIKAILCSGATLEDFFTRTEGDTPLPDQEKIYASSQTTA